MGSPVDAGNNPSFLAVDPAHDTLLAVNEDGGGKGSVASFHIDSKTGSLSFVNRVSSKGDGPAHVATDRTGKFAFVANYGGGTVAVLPIGAGGMLGDAVDAHDHGGNANPHQVMTAPSNKFAFVPNKGLNTVTQYAFDPASGKLTGASKLDVAGGAGPRHLDFSPTAPFAYLINELDSTMSALSYDAAAGKLTKLQTLSTLPAGAQGNNTCAEVQVAPSGKFVYGSNRGHDSIVTYSVGGDGKLTLAGAPVDDGADSAPLPDRPFRRVPAGGQPGLGKCGHVPRRRGDRRADPDRKVRGGGTAVLRGRRLPRPELKRAAASARLRYGPSKQPEGVLHAARQVAADGEAAEAGAGLREESWRGWG